MTIRLQHIGIAVLAVLCAVFSTIAQPVDAVTRSLKRAGITERLGEHIASDAVLIDEDGGEVLISSFFDGDRPVLLNFVYHSCPMLCSMVLEATTKAAREMDWTPGEEYRIISISMSDADTPETSTRQKSKYLKKLGKPDAERGWHFLTGDVDQVARIAESVGFEYEKDEESGEYGHAAALILLSPNGKISRYLYGISYKAFDLRAGLVEASEGMVGNVVDRLIMYCFLYDPADGAYVLEARFAMRVGGGLTVVLLGTFLGIFWVRERRNSNAVAKEMESDFA